MKTDLDIDYEHFAVALFGDRFYHSFGNESTYKKFLKDLSHQLRRTFTDDYQFADGFQKERIFLALDLLDSSLRTTNYEAYYIKALATIIFWMIGDFPDNWQKKNLRGKKICYPGHSRILLYSQNKIQKSNAILEAHKYHPYAERISHGDLLRKRYELGSVDDFLSFYKSKYSDLYLKLF